jgi:hypothetical protein
MNYNNIFSLLLLRATPFERLHTVLLGPCKSVTKALMDRLNNEEKASVRAKLKVCIIAHHSFSLILFPGSIHTLHSVPYGMKWSSLAYKLNNI